MTLTNTLKTEVFKVFVRVIYLIIGPTSEIIFASKLKLVKNTVSGLGFKVPRSLQVHCCYEIPVRALVSHLKVKRR